ncbi:sulfurtransferase complex subunit TusB [Marinobacter orientalis]|uniref:Sulfurtransferase complex subunit TusB n=1 Tax=Marinobacter orientalis TaxID=1928859 RepID=A0A7Y0RCG5_9GAMM|nr:sulfurtransferase complex subunit TusB [Marinobacter orientalis]NMT63691.1 sulfurtransferase complex subunit TusB [Marinobacter orientalis]TGX49806.1 sulfurtransferase complex subunit TusB [Marinobacter orientalis]
MTPLKTLHILNKPPDHSRYRLCLCAIGPEDGLLLTENGVLAVTWLADINSERCFALAPDLEARGLSPQISSEQIVSFEDMVDMAATAEHVISW